MTSFEPLFYHFSILQTNFFGVPKQAYLNVSKIKWNFSIKVVWDKRRLYALFETLENLLNNTSIFLQIIQKVEVGC